MAIVDFNVDNIKVLVFDVDDTVTRGTMSLKARAWEALFNDKIDALREAKDLYEVTGKGDRYNIIAHILGEDQNGCTENTVVQEWAQRFEQLVKKSIRENGIHTKDREVLVKISMKYPIYLLSATPQGSVQGNIEYFVKKYPELQNVFKNMIGTPFKNGKSGELLKIAQEENCKTGNLLMVGDGHADFMGADEAETQFVGVISSDDNKWRDFKFHKIENISEIEDLLQL